MMRMRWNRFIIKSHTAKGTRNERTFYLDRDYEGKNFLLGRFSLLNIFLIFWMWNFGKHSYTENSILRGMH